MGGVAKLLKSEVQIAVGADQLGAGSNDGCAKAYQALRTKCRLQPCRVILSEDCKSAHRSLERAYAAQQLEKHCPRLLQHFLVWYGETRVHTWIVASGDSIDVTADRGLDQGDPLASPVFAVSLVDVGQDFRRSLHVEDPEASVIQLADDIQVCTIPSALSIAADELRRLWATAGLYFNAAKQQTWSLPADQLSEPFQACRVDRLRCLGNTLEQMEDETEQTLPQIGAETMGNDLRLASEKVSKIA